MSILTQDLRWGLRLLRKAPGFTVVVVLSLALGIGANTAIFSLINAVLIRPLPFHDVERLVMVWEDASDAGFPQNTPAPANYIDWRDQNQTFEQIAALAERSYNLTGDGEPERLEAEAVTASFFSLLGVNPLLGRTFSLEDDRPGAAKVAVISAGLWQSRFGGQRSIVGQDILLDGEKHTVVGVMPPGFQFLDQEVNLWVPIALTPERWATRGSHYLHVVARMKPDVTLEQANADIQTVTRRIAHDHPDEATWLRAYIVPLRRQLAGEASRPLIMLLVAVGFVLLIACANVANLLLSRSAVRSREIAVRLALGARRFSIMRQLLTESTLLSALGGTIGVLLASWSFGFLQQLIPPGMTLSTDLRIDAKVLLFTLSVSLLTGLIFGLAPAFQASKTNLQEALKQGSGRTGFGSGSRRLRNIFVVSEIALSLVLLVNAGLLVQTLYQMHHQYSVLHPETVLTLRTEVPATRYKVHAQRVSFYDQVLECVKHLPGVISAGYTTSVPLAWKGGTTGFVPESCQSTQEMSYDANHRQVSPDYFRALGLAVRQGRSFEASDSERSRLVAVINETMARQYWANENPLGRRFKLGSPFSNRPWITIVGIVADVRQMGLESPVKAEMYFPYRQDADDPWFAPRDLVIRSSVDPMSLVAAVRHEIQTIDPMQPLSNIRTLDEILGEESARRRVGMMLLAAFAVVSLLLASLGIYGVLAYFVVQHTPEIGLRLALGAQRRDVLKLVIGQGMRLALVGVVIGVVTARGLTRLIASLLFGVSATDPATFAAIAFLLIGVALLASYLPARRAMRVDPLVALRDE